MKADGEGVTCGYWMVIFKGMGVGVTANKWRVTRSELACPSPLPQDKACPQAAHRGSYSRAGGKKPLEPRPEIEISDISEGQQQQRAPLINKGIPVRHHRATFY